MQYKVSEVRERNEIGKLYIFPKTIIWSRMDNLWIGLQN